MVEPWIFVQIGRDPLEVASPVSKVMTRNGQPRWGLAAVCALLAMGNFKEQPHSRLSWLVCPKILVDAFDWRQSLTNP